MVGIPVLSLRDTSLAFGHKVLFKDLTLDIGKFDKIALVGHNGCGKSTLLKVLTGDLPPDQGERYEEPGLQIAYVPQETNFSDFAGTVGDYLENRLADSSHFYKIERLASALNVDLTQDIQVLSGGEQKRVSLVEGLMQEPDVLLLDEPTNHLDLETIQWLETCLKEFRGAVILISHDRTFLSNVTDTILWLNRAQVNRLDKGFAAFDDWQADLLAKETKRAERLGKILEKEQRWLHRGVTARRRRNQGRLTRLHELRKQRASLLTHSRALNWALPKEVVASQVIIEAFSISKSYSDRPIVTDFSTRILNGDRIGLIGPNGAGKTTLLKMLTGELKPDTGTVRFGKKIEVVYLDQHRSTLNPNKSLKENLCPNGGDYLQVGDKHRHVVAYLKDFMFSHDQAEALVSTLSGGERNRLLLAKSLAAPSSVLVLDEPTNDLDMDTLDMLLALLDDYQGTLLTVSHDRDFLDKTVTSIIAFGEDGHLTEYAGGYSDYLSQRPDKQPEKTSSPKKQTPSGPQKPSKSKNAENRLSYKQSFRLESIPKELLSINKRIDEIEIELHNPNLYEQNPKTFSALSEELSALREKASQLEQEWLDLELLKESFEE